MLPGFFVDRKAREKDRGQPEDDRQSRVIQRLPEHETCDAEEKTELVSPVPARLAMKPSEHDDEAATGDRRQDLGVDGSFFDHTGQDENVRRKPDEEGDDVRLHLARRDEVEEPAVGTYLRRPRDRCAVGDEREHEESALQSGKDAGNCSNNVAHESSVTRGRKQPR